MDQKRINEIALSVFRAILDCPKELKASQVVLGRNEDQTDSALCQLDSRIHSALRKELHETPE